MPQNEAHIETLRERIFAALARGETGTARRGIEALRPHAPAGGTPDGTVYRDGMRRGGSDGVAGVCAACGR